ncbi:MAG: adenine nucleotide alpha hydrolase [Gammaproteobacteria bacterium]|nr:adenine nucleotide alpha hydrolase [Gammaproteobacteria bacterium]
MKKKTLMSWSSGKDSAWALYQLQQNKEVDVVGLFCTVNKEFNRVAMHGVRLELLQKQAESVGLPLEVIEIPNPCSNAEYEKIMGQFVARAKNNSIKYFAFGDLFLEDIRNYREEKLQGSGIKALFPIWEIPTETFSREMISAGLRTVITCIDPRKLTEEFAGREFNGDFLTSLPETIDPCGENGEFHSFVFDVPMFKEKIAISVGEIVNRDRFVFADILPA